PFLFLRTKQPKGGLKRIKHTQFGSPHAKTTTKLDDSYQIKTRSLVLQMHLMISSSKILVFADMPFNSYILTLHILKLRGNGKE
ncbi:hypothetical protein V2V61_11045, partial [Streptococcus agalactiae]